MRSNYPPGAANDPHAPWNEPSTWEATFDVTVEISDKESGIAESKVYKDVTIEIEGDLRDYEDTEIIQLLRDELNNELTDVEYDIIDYY